MASPIKIPRVPLASPVKSIPLATFKNPQAFREFVKRYRENQALWPVAYEEQRLKTSFGRTHLMISGPRDAPPLVLLHGFLNTPLMWRFNIEGLAEQFRVYMPETMGDAGLSRSKQISLRPESWSEWLEELLDALGLDRVKLAGFSLGGWHAARFALNKPARVESLALLSPVPFFRMVPINLLREALSITLTDRKPDVRRLIGKQYAAQFYPDKAYELMQYASLTGYLPNLPLFPREMTGGEWKKLPDRTLVIIGDEEIYFDGEEAVRIARKHLPGENVHFLEETGHSVSIERPGEVNRLLLDFWKRGSR